MKYINKFESMDDKIHIGDYILVHYKEDTKFGGNDKILVNYLNNNIAQIVSFQLLNNNYILVNYEDKPNKNIIRFFDVTTKNKKKLYGKIINKIYIIEVAKTKEDLEAKLAAQKYNLL